MSDKKTIFITVSRAIIVRNLLLNKFFKLLTQNYRVVLFSPLYNDPNFKAKFNDYPLEPLYPRPLGAFKRRLEQFFISLHKALIYNPTIKVASEYGIMLRNPVRFKWLRNNVEKYILGKFFAFNPFRSLIKGIDRCLFPGRLYNDMIAKYRPDLIFITSLGSDDEIALLRNGKARGIPSIGMAVTWDNLSKFGFREKTDHFVVWSQYMWEEAVKFQGYKPRQLSLIGIPQFDNYTQAPYSREEWITKFNLKPDKKTILFGSEGPVCPDDPYIVSVLKQAIVAGDLGEYQILVRPHFAYRSDTERFLPLVDNQIVFIDKEIDASNFKDGTGLSLQAVYNLVASIRYSDAAVTSASTLVLDIVASGRQPIVYNFDKDKSTPFMYSIRRLYETLWFQEIKKIGLDNRAMSEQDLVTKIKELIATTAKDEVKRARLLERFCYKVDGRSGERLFLTIDQFLQKL